MTTTGSSRATRCVDNVDRYADVPVYHVTGWYDSWCRQNVMNWQALAGAKKSPQRLIVGPWTHGGQGRAFAGEVEFPPEAALDFNEWRLRWFDRWVRGVENGVEKEGPVRHLRHGRRRRPQVEGRPAAARRPVARRGGVPAGADEVHPVLPARRRQARAPTSRPRPARPPTGSTRATRCRRSAATSRRSPASWSRAGSTSGAARTRAFARDELPLSQRRDVLVFQTDPLPEDVEVTGPVTVNLYVSSSAVDTDFTAKLIDVYPPNPDYPLGFDLNVGDSIVRMRYRDSLEKAELIEAGRGLPGDDPPVPDGERLREGAPHPGGRLQQQLPAVRREPEHRRAAPAAPPPWSWRTTPSTTAATGRRTSSYR